MRSFLKVGAAAIMLTCGFAFAERADAIPLAPRAALVTGDGLVDQVQYRCRRVWRCGPWGCGWRRVCWGAPIYPYGAYVVPRPYVYPGPYWGYRAYRPWGYGFGYRRYW